MTMRFESPHGEGTVTVAISSHALDQFSERVGRQMGRGHCAAQLRSMWPHVQIAESRPAWIPGHDTDEQMYAVLADVVFPLIESTDGVWVAVTALVRGSKPKRRRKARFLPTKQKRRKHREPRNRDEEDLPWAA